MLSEIDDKDIKLVKLSSEKEAQMTEFRSQISELEQIVGTKLKEVDELKEKSHAEIHALETKLE